MLRIAEYMNITVKTIFVFLTIILVVAFLNVRCCRNDVKNCSKMFEAAPSDVKFGHIPLCNALIKSERIPTFVAKGGLLYYGRTRTIYGCYAYFIIDHINFAVSEVHSIDAVFSSEEELKGFVVINYPGVHLERCPCGCWR